MKISTMQCSKLICAMGLVSWAATGQADPVDVHVEAQPVSSALREFARQCGVQVAVQAELTDDKSTTSVNGRYEPQEALRVLLQGTDLIAYPVNERTYGIRPAPRAAGAKSLKMGQAALTAEGSLAASETGSGVSSARPSSGSTTESAQAIRTGTALEEVIVTAQKREEKLQNVPIAITALSGETLERRGITSFAGIAQATPSITIAPYNNSSSTVFLYMRGLGFVDPAQIAADGAVGLYEDGFYIARPQSITFAFGDLERVEILRGPQGTLYGRNTTGGAINLISKKPSGEFGGSQEVLFGNRNRFRSLTVVDLPRWHDISAKITLLQDSVDGWVKNAGASHDFSARDDRGAKLQLHWDATDQLQADYFLEHGQLDSTPQYAESANAAFAGTELYPGIIYPAIDPNHRPQRTYRAIDLPLSTARFQTHGLTFSYEVNDQLTLKSLTGYRKLEDHAFQNYNEIFGIADYHTQDLVDEHQFSQEFQFVGNLPDSRLNYVVGLYYFDEKASRFDEAVYPFFFGGFSNFKTDHAQSTSKAAFGQITWTPPILDERLSLTVGGRYTRDDKTARRTSGNNFAGVTEDNVHSDLSYNRFNPAVTLNYRWTEDVSTYAKFATAYKAGSSNTLAPVGGFDLNWGPESVKSYEIGLKSLWWDRHVLLNVAAFQTKVKDKQDTIRVSPTALAWYAFNIGQKTLQGVEVELTVNPIEDLTLGLNYAYLHAKLDKLTAPANTIFDPAVNPFSPYQVGDDVRGLFAAGEDGYAPKSSVDFNADYIFARFHRSAWSAHLDYQWKDERASLGPDIPGAQFGAYPAYTVVNGSVTVSVDLPQDRKATLSIWGKNLLNEDRPLSRGANNGSMVPSSSASIANTGYGTIYSWLEPRTYGLTLGYRF